MDPRGGEFLTPQSVRKLMISIAEPTGTVYNPASGVAQLMIEAGKKAAGSGTASSAKRSTPAFGPWRSSILRYTTSRPRLLLETCLLRTTSGTSGPIVSSASRRGTKSCQWRRFFYDPRWVYGEPGPSDGNVAWTQHCLAHLADNGRAVIVLPNAALFESGRAGRIRQRIVKAGLLDAVIALPGGLFAWTGLSCAVLVLVKGRRSIGGKPAPTLMVDLTDSHEAQARISTLSNMVIDETVRLYRQWTRGQAPDSDKRRSLPSTTSPRTSS